MTTDHDNHLMPKVSVIMPLYNCELYIEKAIISMMEQTLTDVEYIIIDDGSTDSSLEIVTRVIKKYPHRKVNLISRSNKGVSTTRDEGVFLSKGLYTIHHDSDDYAEPTWLEAMYNKAVSEKADIVICDYNIISSKSSKRIRQKVNKNNVDNINSLLSGGICNSNWNKLVKRDLYNENNIRFLSEVDMAEDFLVSLKSLYYSNKTVYLDDALYHYFIQNENSLTKNHSKKALHDLVKVTGVAENFIREKNIFDYCYYHLDVFKLTVKSCYISHSNGNKNLIRQGLDLFPEISKDSIISGSSRTLKLFYFLDRYNLLFLRLFWFIIKRIALYFK
jgi:glycosyltransferase involved in cell wall biosynthesis